MINIFNRKMVFTSFSMKEQADVRNALDNNGIKHYVKVVNRRSSSPFANGTRGITGSFGENPEYAREYIIYVHKKDYELAKRCINK